MDTYEIGLILLILLNILITYIVGNAIINTINAGLEELSQGIGELMTTALPEAIQGMDLNQLAGEFEMNPLQQVAIEWIRTKMNAPTVTAQIMDRDEGGKFKSVN